MDLIINNKQVYVLSDVHNDAHRFTKLLDKIHFCNDDILIIAGDIFDKGNQPIELFERIVVGDNIYVIQGNHDVWLADYILGEHMEESWNYMKYKSASILEKHYSPLELFNLAMWIRKRPAFINLFLDGRAYQIAHAQTYKDPYEIMDSSKFYLGSSNYSSFLSGKDECRDFISVVGHLATENRHILISDSGYTIRVDCGNGNRTTSYGQLGVIRLNDNAEYYI